jgi:hypothetical protein
VGKSAPVERSGTLGGRRQSDSHRRALTDFADDVDSAAVQVDTALYDHETETRAWALVNVVPTMEGVEEPLSVSFWNANALIANSANDFSDTASDFQTAPPARRRSTSPHL